MSMSWMFLRREKSEVCDMHVMKVLCAGRNLKFVIS